MLILLLASSLACSSAGPDDGLEAKAAEEGRVRVIATLDVAPLPAGREPSAGELETHRRAVEARRADLETRLASYDCHFSEAPAYTPIAVLEAEPACLRALRAAPEVVSVEEDRLSEPTQ